MLWSRHSMTMAPTRAIVNLFSQMNNITNCYIKKLYYGEGEAVGAVLGSI